MAGDHAHEDHYDPPGGWLFGVKPGEKYENEGWENIWFCECLQVEEAGWHIGSFYDMASGTLHT